MDYNPLGCYAAQASCVEMLQGSNGFLVNVSAGNSITSIEMHILPINNGAKTIGTTYFSTDNSTWVEATSLTTTDGRKVCFTETVTPVGSYDFKFEADGYDSGLADITVNYSGGVGVCATPTTQVGTISFSNVGETSMDLDLSSFGDGDSIMVLAHSGAAVDSNPVDDTNYTASLTYSSGTQIGTGNYVVYKGVAADFPITITGLTGSTTYHYAAYAYNGGCTGGPDFMTSSVPTGSQATTAPCIAPTSAPDVHLLSLVQHNPVQPGERFQMMLLQITPLFSVEKLVLMADNPVDGTAYTASTDWSSKGTQIGSTGWYCVYKGSASGASVAMSNLLPGTAYYFKAYAYNDCASSPKFYTTATLSGNTTTTACTDPTTQVGAVSITNATSSQMDVDVASDGNGDNILIIAHSSAAVDADPVDGTSYTANATFGSGTEIGTGNYVVFNGAAGSLPVTVTGLTEGTTYHFAAMLLITTSSSPKHKTNDENNW